MKRKDNQQRIGAAIKEFLKIHNLEGRYRETEIYARWEELVGRTINLKTTKLILRNNVLIVSISSAVLRRELNMHKSGILEKINMRLRDQPVKDIEFR